MKKCTMCKEEKELTEFHKKKDAKDGLRSLCKQCRSKEAKYKRTQKYRTCIVCGESKLITEFGFYMKTCKICVHKSSKCRLCGEIKPLNEYGLDKNRINGHSVDCKLCHRLAVKSYTYGLDEEEIKELFDYWDHKCAICGSTKKLVIDHNHNLPKGHPEFIRGILCNYCNTAIGSMRDNPEVIRRAADYVEAHKILNKLFRQGKLKRHNKKTWMVISPEEI